MRKNYLKITYGTALLVALAFFSEACAGRFGGILSSFQLASSASTIDNSIPANFFGMTTIRFSEVTPLVSYGTVRTWDSYPELDWSDLNPSEGNFDFSSLDLFIQTNSSKDIVYTFGRTPQWASSQPNQSGPYGPGQCAPPTDITNWDKFVTALATHVQGKIKYFEVWNEPNDPNFYCGDIPTLALLGQHASEIIKSIIPNAKIISPGVTGGYGPGIVDSYFAAGGAQYTDIIGFHGYWSTTPEDIVAVVESYKTVAAKYNMSSTPFWDTEASWAGGATSMTDLNLRAAYVSKYYALQWSMGVTRFIWYAYDNDPWGVLWDATTGLHEDGIAYQETYKWLVGATPTSPCVQDTNQNWTCTYSRSNGYKAIMIWNSISTTTYSAPTGFSQYHDLAGHVTPLTGPTVSVGVLPILLETKDTF